MNYDMFLVHTVAVVLLKVADLFAGILLCFLGKSLFERGIKADFAGEGTVSTVRFKLVTSSPGAIFLVAGLAIVIMSVTTQAKFVELVQSGGVEGSQGSKMEASQAGKSEVAQGNKVLSRGCCIPIYPAGLRQTRAKHLRRKQAKSARC